MYHPGKADTVHETAFETARREATEEIGLPNIGEPLFPPFKVEHLCELPASLARNELVVRPCIAFLHSYDETTGQTADPETALIPRLDAKEVAAMFTARFQDFLRKEVDFSSAGREEADDDVVERQRPEDWYKGSWTTWHESDWRSMYSFKLNSSRALKNRRPPFASPVSWLFYFCVFLSFLLCGLYLFSTRLFVAIFLKLTADQQCITSTSPYPRRASPNPDPSPK